MGDEDGDGMDSGLWGIKAFGGGRMSFEICSQDRYSSWIPDADMIDFFCWLS